MAEPQDSLPGPPDPASQWAAPDLTQAPQHPQAQDYPVARPWPNPWTEHSASSQPTTVQPTRTWPTPPLPAQYPSPFRDLARYRRRKAFFTILVSVAVVVAVCAGGIALVKVAPKSDTVSSVRKGPSASGQTTASASRQATAPRAANGDAITLTAPDQIGTLKRSADQSGVSAQFKVFPNAANGTLLAVVYDDPPDAKAIIFGISTGSTALANPAAELDSFFANAGQSAAGVSIGTRAEVDPDAVGGIAQCADFNGSGALGTICGWVRGDAVVGVVFTGSSVARASELFPQVLQAIVKVS